jgi:uncharacterized iron-regulated membrane protein
MIRKAFFWSHLIVGLLASIVVFVLCLTGALLTFERQSIDWADRSALALPPPGVTERLPADALVASAAKVESARPTSVRYANDPRMPVRIGFANNSNVCVNAYTGAILGRGPTALRAFYAFARRAHVALALPSGLERSGPPIVGACNLAFVFLLLTGPVIWWPRKWKWSALRNSIAIRLDVRGKQRDWNWHNAFGFWALIPLWLMAASGIVLSYRWANLGMREFASKHGAGPVPLVKIAPPKAPEPKPGWPDILASVERAIPGWRSIQIPWSDNKQPQVTIAVNEGYDGEPHKRIAVTVDRASAAVTQVQRWENHEAADRARAIVRSSHSGELGGLPGQALAGLGCLAGVMLVYTGLALSWRRFFGRKADPSSITPSA